MRRKITLLDGAVGTNLWKIAEENNSEKVPVWQYNITHPEFVAELSKRFIDAGAEQILANTFAANRQTVSRAPGFNVSDVVRNAVRIAKESVKGTNVKVSLSVGPLMQMLEPWGDMTAEEAYELFEEQIGNGMDEKPDSIVIQTFIDLDMMKIAADVAKRYNVPVYCMMSFEKIGKTIMGNSVQDFIDEMTPLKIDAIGMNCSIGPDLAEPVMRMFKGNTDIPLMFKPNAGKPILAPDGTTVSTYTAEDFVKDVMPSLEYVDFIGGCCGADPSYIKLLGETLKTL